MLEKFLNMNFVKIVQDRLLANELTLILMMKTILS